MYVRKVYPYFQKGDIGIMTIFEIFNKYRSALEEIREIAKDIIENDVYENSDAKAEKILNKIDEVLNKG